jgi:manganese/zinc/iron transport system permease protein
VLLAAVIGLVSGVGGALLSLSAPRMPTGPWIVLAATTVFAVSLLIAPKRGMITRARTYLLVRRQTLYENILKSFYQLQERGKTGVVTASELHSVRFLTSANLRAGLKRLTREHYIEAADGGYVLTETGRARAARLVKLHRLWEVYLTEYVNLPSDHVHRDAELIEHVITPELERELERLLNRPARDPHGAPIPYPGEAR